MNLQITRKCYHELLTYSLSNREILFLCGGRGRKILHIERVRNSNRGGRHYAEWSDSDYFYAQQRIERLKLKILCEGHSHPGAKSLRHPSEMDVKAIPPGKIEMICFPQEQNIRAWVIHKTLSATLKNPVKIIVIPN